MPAFTLRQLEFFVAVAETGSVSAAAKHTNASAGAVSLSLRELERAVKAQLLYRRPGYGTTVTPTGAAAYQHAKRLLANAESIEGLSQTDEGALIGELRIGCFPTLSPWMVPRVIEFFAQEHPAIDVQLTEDDSTYLQAHLLAGKLDAVIMYRNALAPGVEAELVAPARVQVVLAADHPLAAFDEVPLAALQPETAIALAQPAATHYLEDVLRVAGFMPNVRWRSSNTETIRSMVARGLGYALVMGRPVGDRTYDGLPLVYRRIQGDIPENPVVIARPRDAPVTPKFRALADFCRQKFSLEGTPVQ
ncbi:LysR family transcriptional regulator [Salinibacterium sp. dk2585]|uniref:LysR family transcriptional regulator n=1 Tax=unclassified Salinibacterium TaxID=2632331 RepID=UPI0011C2478C|nr:MULTISPECIES: LysR family transcriptional regulator [unclassified Salinibacterium]QEE61972.1 LysR family transcriptional regulator [Salinibacterium sp. dk2585]TXK54473.1 LysR family transcriptional regulator [Salinibacterium sp. dk5596]